jgi:histidinol-phosphate aminotransferase
MRPLSPEFAPYGWAMATTEMARIAGVDPVEVLRFDGNVPADPPSSARPGTVASALAEVNTYPHGGYGPLVPAIAAYAGVEPENIVLGAGADDLILLCARAFAGPGDTVSVLDEPT